MYIFLASEDPLARELQDALGIRNYAEAAELLRMLRGLGVNQLEASTSIRAPAPGSARALPPSSAHTRPRACAPVPYPR